MAPEYQATEYYYARLPDWIYGRPAELWVRYRDNVAAFVKKAQLQPIAAEHLEFRSAKAGTEAAAAMRVPPFPGGLRMPHLHLADKVYQLDQAQWKTFSGEIMKAFQERLAQAGTVGVERLVELSHAIGGVA